MRRAWRACGTRPREKHGGRRCRTAAASAAACSARGKVVLTASWDNIVRSWDAVTARPLDLTLQHLDAVLALALSPDGRVILTGSRDNSARLWSFASGRPLGPALLHRGAVETVAFSPDGKTILTAHGSARLTPFAAMPGSAAQLARWVEVMAGHDFDASGAALPLSASAWEVRRKALDALGGPPVPRQTWPLFQLGQPRTGESGPFGKHYRSFSP